VTSPSRSPYWNAVRKLEDGQAKLSYVKWDSLRRATKGILVAVTALAELHQVMELPESAREDLREAHRILVELERRG
jgi:hypothetical protein